jgi:hypothetical protein
MDLQNGEAMCKTTPAGFEPARAKPKRFLVSLLNRSDKVSCENRKSLCYSYIMLLLFVTSVFSQLVNNWNLYKLRGTSLIQTLTMKCTIAYKYSQASKPSNTDQL